MEGMGVMLMQKLAADQVRMAVEGTAPEYRPGLLVRLAEWIRQRVRDRATAERRPEPATAGPDPRCSPATVR